MSALASETFQVLLAAGAGAFVGSIFGLRRAKLERQWEAGYQACREILSAIHDMYYWAKEAESFTLALHSVGSKKLRELSTRFEEANHELSSFAHVGGLLISDQCRTALEDLVNAVAKEEFDFALDYIGEYGIKVEYAEHCARIRNIIEERMPHIQNLMRAKLEPTWYRFFRS
jgi:hypothetical protein